MSHPQRVVKSVVDLIGCTPLVELTHCVQPRGLKGKILAKLEMLNPGGSKKDRAALGILREARRNGSLAEGQTVVELTSGNMGTGLAIVCRALGHPFVAIISRGNSIERVRQMKAFGAEVVVVDQAPGALPGQVSGEDLALVESKAEQIVKEREAFRVDQFNRIANVSAHETTTAPELWNQSGGSLDAFLDLAGTCGTFTGVARGLRALHPAIRNYLVEPEGAAVLAGQPVSKPSHKLQGAGYARSNLALYDPALVSGFVQVSDEEAIEAARYLAAEEGILAGFSSGANLAAAWKLLAKEEAGSTIGILLPDHGLKYLSTDLFD